MYFIPHCKITRYTVANRYAYLITNLSKVLSQYVHITYDRTAAVESLRNEENEFYHFNQVGKVPTYGPILYSDDLETCVYKLHYREERPP